MLRNWTTEPLGRLCDPTRGITYGIVKVGEFVPDGIPVIRGGDIRDGRILYDNQKRVSKQVSDSFQRTILTGGEIVLNLIAEPGHSAIVPAHYRGFNVSRDVAVIPLNNDVNHRFVDSFLRSRLAIDWLTARLQGSVTQKINLGTLRELPVPLPPRRVQDRIADILGTLEDKIELNRRMNETLEAMARTIFKSWFVDFDPVHAKAAVRRQYPKWTNEQVSRAALPNLEPEIAELFPDAFLDSELGAIPEGWNVGTVADLVTLDKKSVNPSRFPVEVFDHYSIPAFDAGKSPVCEYGAQIKSNKFVVTGESVLLTKLNPRIPRVWLPFVSADRRSICTTEFLVLKPREVISREFLFAQVSNSAFLDVYETMVTGTSGSHQRIRPEHLLAMSVVLPHYALVAAFTHLISGILAECEYIRRESIILSESRDSLLPKLISGDLIVGS